MLRTLWLFVSTFLPTLLARLRRGPARPSWTFMFEWTIRFLRRDWEATSEWPLARVRQGTAKRPYPKRHLKRVQVSDETFAGVHIRRFRARERPKPRTGTPRIVYLHGGSYIYGSTRHSHADLCAALAHATGLELIGVEYRLAPEHPWPAQLEDARAVCDALDGPLLLAGDSAGGHLAVQTAVALERPPRALALLSPWVDLEMPGASFQTNDRFDFGTRQALAVHARAVAGSLPLADLALARLPLERLPPTFVSLGGAEIPRDDILVFLERLRTAGVEVTHHAAEDMPHNPVFFAAYHPNGRAAFEALVSFMCRRAGM